MKTAIKLVLVYFGMQILAMALVMPFAMLYAYLVYGDMGRASAASLIPSMLGGFLFMGLYLWKKGYLKNDGNIYAVHSVSFLLYGILAGLSSMFILDFIMSHLSFLPDWMKNTFNVLQSGWIGIISVAVLGPILEELLFRGSITKVLLQKYSPTKAILYSGLIFGIIHFNPVQVVGGVLLGFLFAWLYYKSGSIIPGIVIHIMNNSLSVYSNINYPGVDYTSQLIGKPAYLVCVLLSVILLLFSLRMLNNSKHFYTDSTSEV